LQSGKPAASGGFVAELEVEPAPVELVLLPLMLLVLLPELVLGFSLRTCFVTPRQPHVKKRTPVVRQRGLLVMEESSAMSAAQCILPFDAPAPIASRNAEAFRIEIEDIGPRPLVFGL